MRKFVLPLAAIMALGLCLKVSQAAQSSSSDTKVHHVSGVLIDDHCAGKFADKSNPAKAAADHPKACCLKCAKGGGTLVFLTSKKEMKLDKHGQELAMDWLNKSDSKTHVTITGTINGDEIEVQKISEYKPRNSSSSSSSSSSESK